MKHFFQNLLSSMNHGQSIDPYAYQLRTAELLLKGRNVVLTAPTGAGKTWTALFPFVYAKQHNLDFADRVIYALPLRTLASSLYSSTQAVLQQYLLESSIQMGNQPDDPLFEKDVIFTTIDQLLSAYIGLPFGTSRSSANIPPGALIGAYVVIDEFHLLAYSEAFPTLLDMIERLSPYTKFLLMTATASPSVVKTLEKHMQGQAVELSAKELEGLPSKKRLLLWSELPLTAEEIIRRHQPGGRTLVVVNRVNRAQELYDEVQKLLLQHGHSVECRALHARMFARHREDAEKWVLQTFAKNSREEGIVIATQVIEAGLDISADVLLSDHCPANALVQRIGRCARFAGETGEIRVYSLKEGEKRNFTPYAINTKDVDGHTVMELTETWLQQLPACALLTLDVEKELLEYVHEGVDSRRISMVMRDLFLRKDQITRSLLMGDANMNQLIRQVDSLSVIIHNDPAQIDLQTPIDMVSITRRSLIGYLSKLNLSKERLAELVYVPEFSKEPYDGAPVTWHPVQVLATLFSQTLVLLSPEIVSYRSNVGLVLKPDQSECEMSQFFPDEANSKQRQPHSYERETYLEHIEKVGVSLHKKKEHYRVASKVISKQFQISVEQIEEICQLTAALHDVGKLAISFQRQLRRWQVEYKGKEEQELLGHTDYNGRDPVERQAYHAGGYRPPHHAVEGAAATMTWVEQTFHPQIAACILLAIARHHYAFSERAEPFVFAKGAQELVLQSVEDLPYKPRLQVLKESVYLEKKVRLLQERDVLALYWYLVRRVRLADRQSLQMDSSISKEATNAEL